VGLPVRMVERAVQAPGAILAVHGKADVSVAGRTVPGYHLGELLGRGRHGTVYSATRADGNRPVALKVIPFAREDAQLAVAGELERSRVPAHPGVLQHDRHGTLPDGAGMWLDMELCQGSVLRLLSSIEGSLTFERICKMGVMVLGGLAHLHDLGVVHGHIRP